MSETLTLAINGDMTAFSQLYADNFKKAYYIAYHTLAAVEEAVDAVKFAADKAYSEIEDCKTEKDFESLMLKKLCERIIFRFKEYRQNPSTAESSSSYIKALMLKLTDAEKLSVAIWAVYGLGAKEIAAVTRIAEDVVDKKLESAKAKLSAKL